MRQVAAPLFDRRAQVSIGRIKNVALCASCARYNRPRWRGLRVSAGTTTSEPSPAPNKLGKCWLVGAGPGPADYLTMRAVKLLQTADVVVYDDLGSQEALDFVKPSAQLVYVGKRGGRDSIKQTSIDKAIVDFCERGFDVVRLKGGCPAVFSRLADEIAALQSAGIHYELVPGVSSALAAPLFAGFPLTHVTTSPSFTVLSGHDPDSTDWGALAGLPTLVILMGGRNLPTIVERLRDTGWPADTPVVVVRDAGLPAQQVWYSRLDAVVNDTSNAGSLSPCVMVIGKVARAGGADVNVQ